EEKLQEANIEIARVRAGLEKEIASLRVKISRSELHMASLEKNVESKAAENAELTKICDDLLMQIENATGKLSALPQRTTTFIYTPNLFTGEIGRFISRKRRRCGDDTRPINRPRSGRSRHSADVLPIYRSNIGNLSAVSRKHIGRVSANQSMNGQPKSWIYGQ
ncbi:hypothetical protein BJ741DRAFT_682082, partial [Chytriomyces cf. hyalinus JEL632]